MADNQNGSIQRVTGVRDVLPEEYQRRRHVWDTIRNTFELYGYRGVEVPTVEPLDLHLRKSGELIRAHMYEFKDKGDEDVCLRPELTASVARLYNQGLSEQPGPLKLHYCGSSFRYDRPQKGRYREFTQAGVEIIGGLGPEYDAEVIALACNVMNALGLKDYRVLIGNIGITLDVLDQKSIQDKAKSFIVGKLEELGKASSKADELINMQNGLRNLGIAVGQIPDDKKSIITAIEGLPSVEPAKILIAWLLKEVFGFNNESPDDIRQKADDLIHKIMGFRQGPLVQEVLSFISRLTDISGAPSEVFSRARKLLTEYNLRSQPIENLERIAGYLDCYGIDWSKTKISFGFGRGLEYYTGMIFEVHCDSDNLGHEQSQVCGGGRYDTLISSLGGARPQPALGFAFGLERLILAMADMPPTTKVRIVDVLVGAMRGSEDVFMYALRIVKRLREEGLRADVGRKGDVPRAYVGLAKRLGAPFALIVGEDEFAKEMVSLKDMATGSQSTCSIDDAIDAIRRGVPE